MGVGTPRLPPCLWPAAATALSCEGDKETCSLLLWDPGWESAGCLARLFPNALS